MHDPDCLLRAHQQLLSAGSGPAMAELINDAVARNEAWRTRQCLNLVAAESPTSPAVRQMLASEIGTRASGGHIGRNNRFFTGMAAIDEVEALCVELLKKLLHCQFADHRLMGGMAGVLAAYTALTEPGDMIMSASVLNGGDSSHRLNGPPGVRGLTIMDLPFLPNSHAVDLDSFAMQARLHRPKVVGLGMTLTLFPMPVAQIKEIVSQWGGRVYYDAAHQLGLIAAQLFQDPLKEGADLMTGSSGKTFSGPQGGIIAWNDASLSTAIYHTLFPTLTGSHQINRVAALAISSTELIEYGQNYMRQVVRNAQLLAQELERQGVTVLYKEHGYTQTHQLVIQSHSGNTKHEVQQLELANIICNKMPLPIDIKERESGIRLGTTEITRRGMKEPEMVWIAEKIAAILLHHNDPLVIAHDISSFMESYQTLHYCHE